jgi:ribonuclease HII
LASARRSRTQDALPGVPAPALARDAGWGFEDDAWAAGYRRVAGLDEVGRGALAGPVVVAAVVLPRGCRLPGLRDSKLLGPRRREGLAAQIRSEALAISVARVEADTVDRVNVLEATLLAMTEAVRRLDPAADFLLIDALRLPGVVVPQRRLVHGDRLSATIAAASIVAKVERDRLMVEFDRTYPYYGFGDHKGYGTQAHLDALESRGPCPIHRRSFHRVGPVPPRRRLF